MTALATELDAFRTAWEGRVGTSVATMIAGDIETLRGSGLLANAAGAGDRVTDQGNLLDARGRPYDLAAGVAARPLVVIFYRGGWCPYCNLELRAFQAVLDEIRALGADLIAVSPERPDHSLSTAEKNDLSFTVLSDVGGALASALGIRFTLSDTVRPFYEKAGHALPERNGDGTWSLPVPATFVIDRGGVIAEAFVEPDYRRRLEPSRVLEALRRLTISAAA